MAFNPAFMPAGIFGAARKTLQQPEQPEQRSGGFFGQGGTGRAIAGNIGDALMQMSGMRPIYNPTMQHQQRQQAAAQQAQAQRQAEWEDFERQEQYKRANPAPTELERNYQFLSGMGGDLGQQYVENRANPMQGVPITNADGSRGIMFIRPSAMGRGNAGPPDELPADFDFGEPSIENTTAPKLSAGGFPQVLSPAQYQATVNSMGKAATDNWMRRNNIRMGQ